MAVMSELARLSEARTSRWMLDGSVDSVIAGDDLAHQRGVVALENEERLAERLQDDITHTQHLSKRLPKRDRRRVEHGRVEVHRAEFRPSPFGDQSRDHIRGDAGER